MEGDEQKQFHIRLNRYDREALAFMRAHYGSSWSAAIRACIRAAAQKLGFESPNFPTDRG